MRTHHVPKYFAEPNHRITVDLVGAGGTGSQMLSGLARIHTALVALDHPGLQVRLWDLDTVSENNVGRQLFSPADIGVNKAIVLVSRVNRFFGLDWEAMPVMYDGKSFGNILITCIDTAAGRLRILKQFKKRANTTWNYEFEQSFYWMDLGNLQKTGQVILGTIKPISQPIIKGQRFARTLPNVVRKFPQLKKIKEKNQGPSCSLAEALDKQDLFINSTLAQLGCNIIWRMFRDRVLRIHGCYLNLETLSVNPIKIM